MQLHKPFYALLLLSVSVLSTMAQTPQQNMATQEQTNPLLCDIESGLCEMPGESISSASTKVSITKDQLIKVVYFTDPICSSCWGIEPQLRKLKLEYGSYLEIEYRMGGLLPDWSYNSGGISQPSDVAHHWDEVSLHYDMPIDGDIWLEDPLASSYPPSIAFKAAQAQSEQKAVLFLRELRELVFLQKKNIAKWEHMAAAAQKAGLDINQLKVDFEGEAKNWFQEDLKLARQYGVRGFPTLFFEYDNKREMVYGSKAYAFYEMAILQLQPQITKNEYHKDWKTLFNKFSSLTAREFSELSGTPRSSAETILNNLAEEGTLTKFNTKNGAIWMKVNKK